jgi:hypothetical protein
VRSIRVIVEMDEPDGGITTYETHGRLLPGGSNVDVRPEYGPLGVPVSVGVEFSALLRPFDPADREYADSPLFRITNIPPEQIAIDPSAATDNVLMITEGPSA